MEKTIYAEEYRLLLEWLRKQRKRKGLTMRELGKRLNVHHSWIGRIEQGERRMDVMEYARLCDKIGCDAGEGMQLIAPSAGQVRHSPREAGGREKRPFRSSRPMARRT